MMDRPRYENEVIPEDIPLNIVYEDKFLMVVNKPAGLVVHPGHGNYHGTLVNAIAWHMKDIPDYDANDPHVGLVHRIDKDTSGLLVIAKTPDAKTNLGLQFFNKTTKRRYRALVWGNVEQDEGTIVGNVGRNPKDRMQMTVLPDDQGKHAVTHYRVLERLGYVTLVECVLETGRTHQIRVSRFPGSATRWRGIVCTAAIRISLRVTPCIAQCCGSTAPRTMSPAGCRALCRRIFWPPAAQPICQTKKRFKQCYNPCCPALSSTKCLHCTL